MTPVLLVSGRYHFGDQPGVFQDAIYIGEVLEFPMHGFWIDDTAKPEQFTLRVHTTDVETWSLGTGLGHPVLINGHEVGRLKDPDVKQQERELFELMIPRVVLLQAVGGAATFTLAVRLERVAGSGPDDFTLVRIETDGTFGAALGAR